MRRYFFIVCFLFGRRTKIVFNFFWGERMTYRSKIEIICSILRRSRPESRKTHLIRKSNLNDAQFKKYASYLMETGLLESNEPYYKTTKKGKQFLEDCTNILSVLQVIRK